LAKSEDFLSFFAIPLRSGQKVRDPSSPDGLLSVRFVHDLGPVTAAGTAAQAPIFRSGLSGLAGDIPGVGQRVGAPAEIDELSGLAGRQDAVGEAAEFVLELAVAHGIFDAADGVLDK
jgi:hypothetical protein